MTSSYMYLDHLHLRVYYKVVCDQFQVGLICSSVGRALHRYRRGPGFDKALFIATPKISCLENCDGLLCL